MAWARGTEADMGRPTEVGFPDEYGRSLVTIASVDFFQRHSDGVMKCLNLAADVEFDLHQLSKQLYADHCANDLSASLPCDS